jgi:predicted N-acyltransferase
MLQTISRTAPRGTPLPQEQGALRVHTRIAKSIRDVGKEQWNACFEGEVEDFDCLLAVEEAGIDGFAWRYVTIVENGLTIAAMPAFITDYQLETTLEEGPLRRLIHRTRRYFPGFLKLKLACLGSPCTEAGVPGFHPDVPAERKPALMAQILTGLQNYADSLGCSLRGVKDFPETYSLQFESILKDQGFAGIPGLPTAWLDVDFISIDSYLARLSPGTRKDMRRKMKSFDRVRIETGTDFADHLPRVMALYNETRNRSEWQFEALTADYFSGILKHMPGRSFCTFYYTGEKLMAVNILVHNDGALIDKFFCMDGEEGRAYNLYFLSWFTNLRYCLEHRISRYQSGQAYYENKLRLGSQLAPNMMYFKHRNRVVQRVLRLVAPLFAIDQAAGKTP